jgi:hypothetical protein
MRPVLSLVIGLLFTTGCVGVYSSLSSSTRFDEYDNDAIVVIGVSPTARLGLATGMTDKLGWHESGLFPIAKTSWSEDGYAVVKVRPRTGQQTYAIVEIATKVADGHDYTATHNVSVPVFHAHAGQVTYVGSIQLEAYRQVASYDASVSWTSDQEDIASDGTFEEIIAPDDVALVARFVAKKYPNVKAKVKPEAWRLIRKTDY